jgi:hypothetical protein
MAAQKHCAPSKEQEKRTPPGLAAAANVFARPGAIDDNMLVSALPRTHHAAWANKLGRWLRQSGFCAAGLMQWQSGQTCCGSLLGWESPCRLLQHVLVI